MNRNSTTIFIETGEAPNRCITPVPWIKNAPDFTGFENPTLSILITAYEKDKGNIIVIPDPLPQPVMVQPDPKGFYEKMIGVRGDYPLYQVYQSISFQALDQTKDTSSLSYAVTVFLAALTTNDWSQEYAKSAYAQAYGILKPFLSVGQATIVEAENKAFNLV